MVDDKIKKEISNNFNTRVSYKNKIENFVKIYLNSLDKLDKLANDSRKIFIKNKFIEWFENKGYILLLDGISYLKEDDSKRFYAFCKIYCFYLSEGKDDFDKIIDFLYIIPVEIEKVFLIH